MFLGEGPGAEEDRWGRPFVGKAGKELNHYMWDSLHRMRTSAYITNLVKYRVPDNEDPTPEDIRRDAGILSKEITTVNPKFIASLGRCSTRHLLGDVDMEVVHGIAHRVGGRVVVPVFHPASGLHNTENQAKIAWDMEQLAKAMRGDKDARWAAVDTHPDPDYCETHTYLNLGPATAVDTEGSAKKPWCLSATSQPGIATVVRTGLAKFGHIILHFAMADIPVLRAMDAEYDTFDDTGIMAYNLCIEPQGLKALAKRHCGMDMQDYQDLTDKPSKLLAAHYMWRMAKWLDKRSNNGSTELQPTTTKNQKQISVNAGLRSKRTSRKRPPRLKQR